MSETNLFIICVTIVLVVNAITDCIRDIYYKKHENDDHDSF